MSKVEVEEPACKPNSVLSELSGDHSSGRRITAPVMRPTRKRASHFARSQKKNNWVYLSFLKTGEVQGLRRTTLINVSLFGLAPQGVCLAEHVATLAGDAFTSPFHHRHRG